MKADKNDNVFDNLEKVTGRYFGPIDSPETWWKTVDSWWDEFLAIFAHHLSMTHAAYEKPGKADTPQTGRSVCEELEYLKEARDAKLASYFSATWCMASDAYAWSVPGWGQLCDLCSESYMLYEDETP